MKSKYTLSSAVAETELQAVVDLTTGRLLESNNCNVPHTIVEERLTAMFVAVTADTKNRRRYGS